MQSTVSVQFQTTFVSLIFTSVEVSVKKFMACFFGFLQAWEDYFKMKMMKLRENEFQWISISNKARSLGTILSWMAPVLVSSLSFGAYVFLGHNLSPAVVFTSLSVFRIIQDYIRLVPDLLAIIIQVCSPHLGLIASYTSTFQIMSLSSIT